MYKFNNQVTHFCCPPNLWLSLPTWSTASFIDIDRGSMLAAKIFGTDSTQTLTRLYSHQALLQQKTEEATWRETNACNGCQSLKLCKSRIPGKTCLFGKTLSCLSYYVISSGTNWAIKNRSADKHSHSFLVWTKSCLLTIFTSQQWKGAFIPPPLARFLWMGGTMFTKLSECQSALRTL